MMSKWRDDFEQRFGTKTTQEVKEISKIQKADEDLSKILANQNQKMRNEKIKKEVEKLLKR